MKHKHIPALVLALILSLSLAVTSYAASSTTASVPVTLTVKNEYRAVNVTVPAALPVYVINGTVVVADNAKIINNSATGAVKVTSVAVTNGAYKVGDYDDFSGNQTIALKINGCSTHGEGALAINESAFPILAPGGDLLLTYYAKISGDAANTDAVEAAHVVITISIAD